MGKAIVMSADDKEWRAKDDMRTLAEARKIEKDKERMAAAKAMAKKMLEESRRLNDELNGKK